MPTLTQEPNNQVSQIQIPGGDSYYLKDAYGRVLLLNKLELVVATELPQPSANYLNKIYLIPHTHSNSTNLGTDQLDNFDEFIEIELAVGVYAWERFGNTDIDLSGYSTTSHRHRYNKTDYVANHFFTPDGDIVSTCASTGGHSHTVTVKTQYLQKTNVVQYLTLSALVPKPVLRQLQTTTVQQVSSTTVQVSKATAGTAVDVAKAGSNVQFYSVNTIATSTAQKITPTNQLRATGNLGSVQTTQYDNSPLWSAQVNNGVMNFLWKPLTTSQTVQSVSIETANAQTISTTQQNIKPAVSNGSITPWTFTQYDVAQPGSNVTVANGKVNGSASSTANKNVLVQGTSNNIQYITGIGSVDAFTGMSATDTSGVSVVKSVNAATGSSGNHTHVIESTFVGYAIDLDHDIHYDPEVKTGLPS